MHNVYSRTGLRWLWITLIIVVLDRLTKFWVQKTLVLHVMLPVTSFFNLTLAHNTGAAFSFLNSASGWQVIFFGCVALFVSVAILIWLSRLHASQKWLGIALALVLGGALGNLIDRLLQGYVTDFLDFHWSHWHFAAFNIADSAICVGAFMLVMDAFVSKGKAPHMRANS